MVVSRVLLRDFRSYAREELALADGFVLIVGANGAGKTNLLDAVHLGSQGFSVRTRRDSAVVRFGADAARVELHGRGRGGTPFATEVTIERGGSKLLALNGAAVPNQEELRRELPVLAFTPDRLAVVKGGPAVRRTYVDRMIGRLAPAKAAIPGEYSAALAQRNAALRRLRTGLGSRDATVPWTAALAGLARTLEQARSEAIATLAPLFSEEAERLGLLAAVLGYAPSDVTLEALVERLEHDLERGATGIGPHLQDLELTASGADLRNYGSQGQQRLAVLALLLAESRAITAVRTEAPLLLLDDVLSELDDDRRTALLAGVPAGCQVLVTSTTERAVPAGARPPAQVVEVAAGKAQTR